MSADAEAATQRALHVGHLAGQQFDKAELVEAQIELTGQRLLRTADGDLAVQTSVVVQSAVYFNMLIVGRKLGVDAELVVGHQRRFRMIGVSDAAVR